MGDFTFELVASSTMSKIGELTQATGKTFITFLNKPGSFSMSLPLADPFSSNVEEMSTGVIIKRRLANGNIRPIWSGAVYNINESTPDSLSVDCVGWLQTYEKRVTKPAWGLPTLQYEDDDAGSIVMDLLARTNADNDFGTNYVFPGFYEPTQLRSRSLSPWSSILSTITDLSELESGYDMALDPLSRELNIYVKIGVIRPKVLFEYDTTAPKISRVSDSSRIVNRFIAYSAIGFAVAEDQESIAKLGLVEEAQSLSDVSDISILQAYANAEIAVRSRPLRFCSFDAREFSSMAPDDPRIFEHFDIGDVIYLKAKRGRLDTGGRQAVRLFGATINFDDDTGRERLTSIQTIAS